MKLDLHLDTEQDDVLLIKDICAVLAGVSVKADITGPGESKRPPYVVDLPTQRKQAVEAPKGEWVAEPKEVAASVEPEQVSEVDPQAAHQEKVEEAPSRKVQPYDLSEDELKGLPTDVLMDMLKDLGVNPDKFSGKNTNKKLRDLILACSDGVRPQEPGDDTDDEEANAPKAVSGEAHAPMTYEQAKPLVTPLWRDPEKKKIIQGIMVKHGCVKDEGGVKHPQFAAFEAIGKDYRAMVEEIVNYKYE